MQPSTTSTRTAGSRQKDMPAPVRPERCPVEDWLGFLGHRWNALLLWHLQERPMKHQDLLAALPGITAKVLSERLKALQERGLVQPRGVRDLSAHGGLPPHATGPAGGGHPGPIRAVGRPA